MATLKQWLGLEKRADQLTDRLPAGYNPTPASLESFYSAGSVFGEPANTNISGLQRAAARLYASCLSTATFESSPALQGMTPAVLFHIAETIITRGEVFLFIDPRDLSLIPAPYAFVEMGGYNPSGWQFRLNLAGPSANTDMLVGQDAVLHIQWAADYTQPWVGVNPFDHAAGQAALRYEKALSADGAAPVLQFLSIPQSIANPAIEATAQRDNEAAVRKELQDAYNSTLSGIRRAEGGGLTIGSSFKGTQPRGGSPFSQSDAAAYAGNARADDKPIRWGPEPHAQMMAAYTQAATTALSACNIPPGLILGGLDGSASKEQYRQFYLTGLQSLAGLVEAEVRRKLGPVELVFDKLQAADIQARSRAYKGFIDAGMSSDDALKLVGLMETPQ